MTETRDAIHSDIEEIMPGVIADRRYLHQHPELGFQEHETARFIVERLAALGVTDIRTGVGKTGVTGLIVGEAGANEKTVMIRADMDALPIYELNEVDYRSLNDGAMHACGHDSHVSIQLGAARWLTSNRDKFSGTVKVLFQPAEEGLGGASAMIADGALEDPKVDATFGLHIWQEAPVGTVEIRETITMVAADGFTITIQGRGGHGARPQKSVDPIVVGAEIILALQTLVSRENDPTVPAVVTIGAFNAGNAANVIPDTAVLKGTTRTVSNEQRQEVAQRLQEIAAGVAQSMRADVQIDFRFGVPPTVNDPAMAAIVWQAAETAVGSDNVSEGPLKVVSEDYSEFLERVPGCFFFVGSRNEHRGLTYGHHNARFDIDEEGMGVGIETMIRSVLGYLNG